MEGRARGIEQAWEVPLCVDFITLSFDRQKGWGCRGEVLRGWNVCGNGGR